MVSPARASRRAALTVGTGPSGATTMRRAGAFGPTISAATRAASMALPTVPSGPELFPGEQGSTEPRSDAVGGRARTERHEMTGHRRGQRIHPEVDGLARIEQRVRLEIVVHPQAPYLIRGHGALLHE